MFQSGKKPIFLLTFSPRGVQLSWVDESSPVVGADIDVGQADVPLAGFVGCRL
jgi:hypothetical protein